MLVNCSVTSSTTFCGVGECTLGKRDQGERRRRRRPDGGRCGKQPAHCGAPLRWINRPAGGFTQGGPQACCTQPPLHSGQALAFSSAAAMLVSIEGTGSKPTVITVGFASAARF